MPTQAALRALLDRIFHDGIVTPEEREELASLRGGLPPSVVEKEFHAFLVQKWGEAMKDDVLTAVEVSLLARIVQELELDHARLPLQARHVLSRHG